MRQSDVFHISFQRAQAVTGSLPMELLVGCTRKPHEIEARKYCVAYCRTVKNLIGDTTLGLSYAQIGKWMNRHHASVMNLKQGGLQIWGQDHFDRVVRLDWDDDYEVAA